MCSSDDDIEAALPEPGLPVDWPLNDAQPLGPELTQRLTAISRSFCESEGGCHGPDHTERVHNLALHIGRLMGARLDILSAAALLHDIGRSQETRAQGKVCHAEIGAKLAARILEELGVDVAMRHAILHCIESHRFRNDKVPESLEARILFDADKLDSIGAIGIGRAFLFAGQVGARLHNRDVDVAATSSYSVEDTAYREFLVKLGKVKDLMLTPEGKRLAAERHAFMELFFARLDREIHGAPREPRDHG
ncbi:MAG: HD domain-containing protein [Thermodesulfobacteriota bacterium]